MTAPSTPPRTQTRLVELDALRGLAALAVVLHHLRAIWQTDTHPSSGILQSILNLVAPIGSEAVILFFVLSGFVLSLPAVNGRPQSYFTFVTRRVFRIYVPYLAALAVSVAGAYWFHGIITGSAWFNRSWSEPVNWGLVGQHVLFLGVYNTNQFNPPIWSLVHEMRISLIFPLLCALVLRFKSKWSFVVVFGITAAAILIQKPPFEITLEVADSVYFAAMFVLGIFLARERGRLGGWFSHRRRFTKALICVASLWLFLFASAQFKSSFDMFSGHIVTMSYISQWITALGAGGLIVISTNSAMCNRAFSWPPIHFLGKTSYSLYLLHFTVMLFCVHLLYGRVPLLAILFLVLVLSLVVSWCSYRLIEIPSMNLGRELTLNQAPRNWSTRKIRSAVAGGTSGTGD
jgi:peptidoglycan/LPS O-acetylase OafA/YrhL